MGAGEQLGKVYGEPEVPEKGYGEPEVLAEATARGRLAEEVQVEALGAAPEYALQAAVVPQEVQGQH